LKDQIKKGFIVKHGVLFNYLGMDFFVKKPFKNGVLRGLSRMAFAPPPSGKYTYKKRRE